jgi:two-component system, LytTR family, sensor kinase
LYAGHEQFVSFEEELRLSDLYLRIELMRFNDRLQIQKNVSRESLHVQVPHFILQPIIENAIKHGIAAQSKASLIALDASVSDNTLSINVYNNGPSLPDNWKREESQGIGLKNVSGRLEKIYGNQGHFSIRNHTDKGGVEVSLQIPLTHE